MLSAIALCLSIASAQSFSDPTCRAVPAGKCEKNVSAGRCPGIAPEALCCCDQPLTTAEKSSAKSPLKNAVLLGGPIAEILWNSSSEKTHPWNDQIVRGPQMWTKSVKGQYWCTNQQFTTVFVCQLKKITPEMASVLFAAMDPTTGTPPASKILGDLKCSSKECSFSAPAKNIAVPADGHEPAAGSLK
jgi:hypothetical protein